MSRFKRSLSPPPPELGVLADYHPKLSDAQRKMSNVFPSSIYDNSNYNSIVNKDELVYNLINKHSLQKKPDDDDKLVIVPGNAKEMSDEQILRAVNFQEKWFDSIVIR